MNTMKTAEIRENVTVNADKAEPPKAEPKKVVVVRTKVRAGRGWTKN